MDGPYGTDGTYSVRAIPGGVASPRVRNHKSEIQESDGCNRVQPGKTDTQESTQAESEQSILSVLLCFCALCSSRHLKIHARRKLTVKYEVCSLCFVLWTLCSVLCDTCSVLRALCSVLSARCSVLCASCYENLCSVLANAIVNGYAGSTLVLHVVQIGSRHTRQTTDCSSRLSLASR